MTKQFVLEARKPNMHIAMSQSYLLVQKACKYLDQKTQKTKKKNKSIIALMHIQI